LLRPSYMVNGTKDDDIRDVMAEEKSRGRRPRDAGALKERRKHLEELRVALTSRTEQEFLIAIRGLALDDDPEKFAEALRIWRASSFLRRR
jgi:hypothetical protein